MAAASVKFIVTTISRLWSFALFGRQIIRVTDRIWCVRRPSYLTCSYAVETDAGPVLIDAGMDSGGADVPALLSAMKMDASSVRAVLLTHWHNDHASCETMRQTLESSVRWPLFG